MIDVVAVDRPYSAVTLAQKELFLATLAETASELHAASIARPAARNSQTALEAFKGAAKTDPEFQAAWRSALEKGQGILEEAAYDRALNGTEEDVYHQGVVVGKKINYDNKFTLAVLRRNARKLGDKSWEESKTVTHEGQTETNVNVRFRDLPAEERRRILDMREAAKQVSAGGTAALPPAVEPSSLSPPSSPEVPAELVDAVPLGDD